MDKLCGHSYKLFVLEESREDKNCLKLYFLPPIALGVDKVLMFVLESHLRVVPCISSMKTKEVSCGPLQNPLLWVSCFLTCYFGWVFRDLTSGHSDSVEQSSR